MPTPEQAQEIKRLNELFFENEHDLLRGGRMKAKDKRSIETLYYDFFNRVDNHDWSKDLIDIELDNLKRDPFCKRNTNKSHWTMTMLLNWVVDLPKKLDVEYLYYALSSREANQRLIKYAYFQ